jgi:hypothetical protein
MQTKLMTFTAGLVLTAASLGGSAAAASSACPERAACQVGKRPAPPHQRVSFELVSLGPGACGAETFAIVINGRRTAIVC